MARRPPGSAYTGGQPEGTTAADGTVAVGLVAHNGVLLRATPPAATNLAQAAITNLDARTDTNNVVIMKVDAAAVTSIAVTPANPHSPKGATRQFTATATFTDGSTQDVTSSATWSSSSPATATVSTTGLATAVATGSSTVQAILGSVSGQTSFTVDPAALVSVAVTPANPSVVVGATKQFAATGTYTDGSTVDLTSTATWSSSSASVATVTSGGLATGAAVGSATITATSGSIAGSTTLTVSQATPTITWADPAGIVYGTALGTSQLNASASAPGTFSYSPAAGTVLHVGAGQVLSVTFTPTDTANYTTASKAVHVTVTAAALSVTADSKSRVVGQANPALTATISGFVNGDTPASLTAQPSCSTTATTSSPAGSYPITCSGAASPDYSFAYTAGTLTVNPAATLPTLAVADVAVPEGDSGTSVVSVTVSRSGDTSGVSSVKVKTTNGSALAGSDYGSVPLTTVTFGAGESAKSVPVTIHGDTLVETDETFSVKLSAATNATIFDDTGVVTIVNDDAPPGLAVADVSITEGNSGTSSATFTVTRSGNTSGASTVKYKTANGSATAGSDYVALPSTTLSFAAGETAKSVSVTVNGDTVVEGDETAFLQLSAPLLATIVDGSATLTIVNDDAPASLSVNDVSVVEGNVGSTTVTFTVTRSGNTSAGSTVKYKTVDGTAKASTGDYVAVPLTLLSFAAGETTKAVAVTVNTDLVNEADETFLLNLSAPVGAVIADGSGTAVIVNDDTPSIAVSALDAGGDDTCAIRVSNSALVCWGKSDVGQLGVPTGAFKSVDAGLDFSCAVRSDDTAACWGKNDFGQTNAAAGVFTMIDAGGHHACGLRPDASIACWGRNLNGQASPPPGSYLSVTSGMDHSCALRSDHTIVCWGLNTFGRLDAPTGTFSQVKAGDNYNCAIRSDSTLVCWGKNDLGQLNAPTGAYFAVDSGGGHSCALKLDGTPMCWGENLHGQTQPPPATFNIITVGAGHSCGQRPNNTVLCWGANLKGQATPPTT